MNGKRKSGRITKKIKDQQKLKFILTSSSCSQLEVTVKQTENMGRGIFTTCERGKGDFIMKYPGELLNEKEAKQRLEEIGDTGYIFWFKHQHKWMCIDGTSENIKDPGRLVNHSKKSANMIVKLYDTNLVFVAKEKITVGSQLFYDYNDTRKDVINENMWLNN